MTVSAFQDLSQRGFIYQTTDAETIEQKLDAGPISFYTGFDPTADSLHVGHLLPIMAMRRLQQAGHIPIALVGGATALIGDPSGKQESRPILAPEDVAENAAEINRQLARFLDPGDGKTIFVNNAQWFQDMKYIDFMRSVGHRFSVNRMLSAESVKLRLDSDSGISYLEFSYMLLQAYDFYQLNREYDCRLQLGGQDQWGNIVAGVDLTRRMAQQEVFGMTFPLLMDASGQKFGKTNAGAVWLDPNRTPVFDYYQFWRNCEDTELEKLLKLFTGLPVDEISRISKLPAPDINRGKEILAYEATALAHGHLEAEKAYLAAAGKFGFADPDANIETSSSIVKIKVEDRSDELPSTKIPAAELEGDGIWIVKLLTDAGLCSSNGEARRLIKGGGAYLNEQRVESADYKFTRSDLTEKTAILRAGKKNIRRIIAD